MTTIRDLLLQLKPQMEETPAENPARELRLLIAYILNTTYDTVFFHEEQELTLSQIGQIQQAVSLRRQHMPLAKIIGQKEFWGLSFKVTRDTLDPRPESETLIETILELFPDKNQLFEILDLGTGTGCLLLSTLNEYPQAHGVGIDISEKALDITKQNAHQLALHSRCSFYQGSWFSPLQKSDRTFDLIISNPPYIAVGTSLSQETLYDPEGALFAPEQGLLPYRLILEQAGTFLNPSGYIVFEIGKGQEEDVINLATQNGYTFVCARKDILGYVRCLVFKFSRSTL